MPKMKTHKATVKRLHVTGSGKVMHRRSGQAHLMAKKSAKRKRRFAIPSQVHKHNLAQFKELIRPGGEL